MTSKEALERLSKYNNHYVKDKEYLLIDVESEEWKTILKDLEQKEKQDKILSILKKNAYIYADEIDIEITDTNEHFEKIKEVLDNDK